MREHGSVITALRPRKPWGSLGRTAQDGHLDSHTAPELWVRAAIKRIKYVTSKYLFCSTMVNREETWLRPEKL